MIWMHGDRRRLHSGVSGTAVGWLQAKGGYFLIFFSYIGVPGGRTAPRACLAGASGPRGQQSYDVMRRHARQTKAGILDGMVGIEGIHKVGSEAKCSLVSLPCFSLYFLLAAERLFFPWWASGTLLLRTGHDYGIMGGTASFTGHYWEGRQSRRARQL